MKTRINNFALWILFGFAWVFPQIMIIYYSDYEWIKIPVLIIFGIFIIFTNLPNKLLLEGGNNENKKQKHK
jgi:hypothetical protein